MEEDKSKGTEKTPPNQADRKPNEFGGFYLSSHLKIFDPNTQKVIVQKRGDN